MEDPDAFEDGLGPEGVRQKLSMGLYDPTTRNRAIDWLSQVDQRRLDRSDSSISEQILLARHANRIASQARAAAITAAIAAIMGAMAAILGIPS